MDEPFAALDAITRLKMQDDIHRIAEEEGVTVVFVTHDIEEAVALADRIVVLTPNPGQVKEVIKVELGPDRLRTADDFLAVRDHVFDVFGMKPNLERRVCDLAFWALLGALYLLWRPAHCWRFGRAWLVCSGS